VRQVDQEYKNEEILVNRDKKVKAKQLQQQLLHSIYLTEERKKSEKEKQAMEDEKAELWRARKVRQYKMRKEREQQWHEQVELNLG
jgi:aspartyl/asparaginyl beta-hydroxylase (cupin superfamily)